MNLIEQLQQEQDASEHIAEFDQLPPATPRFDAESLQLETRGTTQRIQEGGNWRNPSKLQYELWNTQTIHKNTVAAKLRQAITGQLSAADSDLFSGIARKLELCHTEFTFCQCLGCGKTQKFPNRCDLFCCPECQPRNSHDRRRAVGWWVSQIKQPKHVVLTVRNIPELTAGHRLELLKWFRNLRKRKFCKNWNGGFYSVEVTNEGRGWHLHLHVLVDARWIDSAELSRQWESVTNGMARIVKVKDCRGKQYLNEVTKYAVKGPQLAAWSPETLATFVTAFSGARTFGVFGSLYGKRTEFADWWKEIRDTKMRCTCGCDRIIFRSEVEWALQDFQPYDLEHKPPPHPTEHQEIFGYQIANQHAYPR